MKTLKLIWKWLWRVSDCPECDQPIGTSKWCILCDEYRYGWKP